MPDISAHEPDPTNQNCRHCGAKWSDVLSAGAGQLRCIWREVEKLAPPPSLRVRAADDYDEIRHRLAEIKESEKPSAVPGGQSL